MVQTRYLLVACVCYGLFSNHWARDSLGALEAPLESDAPYSMSVRAYNALTSIYFLPNLVAPVLAGVLAAGVYVATDRLCVRSRRPMRRALMALPILYGATTLVMVALTLVKSNAAKGLPLPATLGTSAPRDATPHTNDAISRHTTRAHAPTRARTSPEEASTEVPEIVTSLRVALPEPETYTRPPPQCVRGW